MRINKRVARNNLNLMSVSGGTSPVMGDVTSNYHRIGRNNANKLDKLIDTLDVSLTNTVPRTSQTENVCFISVYFQSNSVAFVSISRNIWSRSDVIVLPMKNKFVAPDKFFLHDWLSQKHYQQHYHTYGTGTFIGKALFDKSSNSL